VVVKHIYYFKKHKLMNLKTLLVAGLIFSPVSALSQQVNVYQTCTTYKENYIPGYYDRYGNYVQGTVNTQRYSTSCGNANYYQQPVVVAQPPPVYANTGYRRGYCSPARTTLGGLIGGGIAAASSKKSAWSWAIPLGAVLGTGAANATCN
jgi:hypothetical protein